MSKLFEKTTIKGMTLANRFVRSATWEGLAEADGTCTQELIDFVVRLARGGVGLIITGHAYVSPEGQAGPRQMGIHRDDLVEGLSRMTDAVNAAGGTIVVQLAHAGCQASSTITGREPLGPSVLEGENGPLCREMTPDEIQRTIRAFNDAAARAKRAGFDGVQIHAAHGYLLSEFLSPYYNRRKDAYGSGLENRARIVLEVYRSIREAVGDVFPVMIKLNAQDFLEGGLSADEMLQVAALLENAGIDAIEMSGGTASSGKFAPVRKGNLDSPEEEVYYREEAKRYRERIRVPLMLVGGVRSLEVAERVVSEGLADYVSLCRPLIREPELIQRWRSGDTRRATCQSDNLCFRPTIAGEGLYCVVEKRLQDRKATP